MLKVEWNCLTSSLVTCSLGTSDEGQLRKETNPTNTGVSHIRTHNLKVLFVESISNRS